MGILDAMIVRMGQRAPQDPMNEAVDRALGGYANLNTANFIADRYLKTDATKVQEANQRLQLLRSSREMGIDPEDAMTGDIISEDSPQDDWKTNSMLNIASKGGPALQSARDTQKYLSGNFPLSLNTAHDDASMMDRFAKQMQTRATQAKGIAPEAGFLEKLLGKGLAKPAGALARFAKFR